jgi:hypothetical protein
MVKEVLYATNNQGKIAEVSKLLLHNDIGVVSPKDLVKSHLKSGLVDDFERPRLFDLVPSRTFTLYAHVRILCYI